MALGPGKYDDLCTMVRERADAVAVILIVIDGERGPGFSVQAREDVTIDLPGMLEVLAARMRADLEPDGPVQ